MIDGYEYKTEFMDVDISYFRCRFEENEAFQAGRQLKWTEFARKLQVA